MSDGSTIEWLARPGTKPATWNPVRGCSRVSEGCRHCYAEELAARFSNEGMWGHGFAERTGAGARWTGRVELIREKLGDPLRWRDPRTCFANSTSDLFHESLTFEEIAAAFGVMAACPRHTFIVLTKRAERMLDWFRWVDGDETGIWDSPHFKLRPAASWALGDGSDGDYDDWGDRLWNLALANCGDGAEAGSPWPLPNVWLMVSAEDQPTADERVPFLLQCPAVVHGVSAEPLLGPIDLRPWLPRLTWVICGGESGRGARPCRVDWIRSIRDQCSAAGVPCFVKQVGARPRVGDFDRGRGPGRALDSVRDRKGADPSEWPEDLRVREHPQAAP